MTDDMYGTTDLFHSEGEVQRFWVVVSDPQQAVVKVRLQSLKILQRRRPENDVQNIVCYDRSRTG